MLACSFYHTGLGLGLDCCWTCYKSVVYFVYINRFVDIHALCTPPVVRSP